MRFLTRTIVVASLALSASSTAKAAMGLEHCRQSQSARRELVCAQRALRARRGEEQWIVTRKARTLFAANTAQDWRSRLRFVRWRIRVDRGTIAIARARLQRGRGASTSIGHVALWLCIHRGEGAWNANTGNGYFGGLQMTSGWGGVARPDLLSASAQMQLAETQYRASGYSIGWLEGQWPNTSPPCLEYA